MRPGPTLTCKVLLPAHRALWGRTLGPGLAVAHRAPSGSSNHCKLKVRAFHVAQGRIRTPLGNQAAPTVRQEPTPLRRAQLHARSVQLENTSH